MALTLSEAEELELLELEEEEARAGAPAAAQEAAGDARPSQADVRASEPPQALASQSAAERGFDAALKAWLQTPAGRPFNSYPYNADPLKVRAEFSRRTGRPDPRDIATRDRTKLEHLRETGEVIYDDNPAYKIAKPLAAMAGFAGAGPSGATAAEGAVRALALTDNLDKAVKAGVIDEDRAREIWKSEMVKGGMVDAAWNWGTPLVLKGVGDGGKWLAAKVPGAKWLTEKVSKGIDDFLGKPTSSVLETERAKAAAAAQSPERKQAVEEIHKRVGDDTILTRGQVTGETPMMEAAANKGFPAPFEKQEEIVKGATEKMRRELLYPGGQPGAKELGERVITEAERVEKAVKDRLRPAFEMANDVGVAVNLADVAAVAKAALAKDAAVLGKGKLSAAERAHLEEIVADAARWPTFGAEATLDFISVQKQKLRSLNVDGKPTPFFETIVGKLTSTADDAFSKAVRAVKRGDVVQTLEAARKDYRGMMETVFDDAMKTALKKGGTGSPDAIGQYLWQKGNVSRIEQLDEMLKLSQREGTMSRAAADKMRRDVTRGFLQEAVKDVQSAAKFSESIAKDPKLARTWETLTSGPAGKQLRDGMKVLEEAAKMATFRDTAASKTVLPMGVAVGRAAQGGLGVSLVTGAIHPGMAAAGLSIATTLKLMATAYVHGDKGAINLVTKVMRLRNVRTPAAANALQEALPALEALAQKYGTGDVLVPLEGEEQKETE